MLLGRYGQNNQAGDLSPRTGPYGTAVDAHLGALFVHPVAIIAPHGYDGYVGNMQAPNGVDEGVVYTADGYYGDLPSTVQPTSARFAPWLEG